MGSSSPRMTRCAITGAEVPLAESFVLDLRAAHARVRDLRNQIAAVERVINTLAFTVTEIQGPPKREVRQRLTVSFGVAAALDTDATRGLFVAWDEMLPRQSDQLAQRMLHHPLYGARLRALDLTQRLEAVALGRRILGRLTARVGSIEQHTRLAISWGVAVALVGASPEEAIEKLLGCDDKALLALGVSAAGCAALRDVVRRYNDAVDEDLP